MRPLALYEFGIALANAAAAEVERRTAVNRIYYGLHHEACCRYFRQTPTPPALDRNRRHTELRRRFSDATNPAMSLVGTYLGQLERLRAEADYQLPAGSMVLGGRPCSDVQVLAEASRKGALLLQALETLSPGQATDGCPCLAISSFSGT